MCGVRKFVFIYVIAQHSIVNRMLETKIEARLGIFMNERDLVVGEAIIKFAGNIRNLV